MSEIQGAQVKRLPSRDPSPPEKGTAPAHWVGQPAQSFKNPWPSFQTDHGLFSVLQTRFASGRNFVPVPESREELVQVRTPDWGRSTEEWEGGIKATWLGHAGFLVETSVTSEAPVKGKGETQTPQSEAGTDATSAASHSPERRGIRILFDAVFSERTSPVSFAGPKRFTPPPCTLEELPHVDVVVTSHDHYDHMDLATIRGVCAQQVARGEARPHFLAGLGNGVHFLGAGAGLEADDVTECDWWDSVSITVPSLGEDARIELTCTPTQHFSGRGVFDRGRALWCSWCVDDPASHKRLFFAGDTAYKAQGAPSACPAFKQIGEVFGPFDLALLPIGCFLPRDFMGNVHCAPDDSLEIHKDIRSKKSIGMHYGSVRGGLSQYYEDVRDPPRRWKEVCEKEQRWGTECGLCDVGETVVV